MTRHIDADKLKDQFEPLDWYSGGMVISMINHAKTVPVRNNLIHCKDCKYQVKRFCTDKRYKEGGYWEVGCNHFGEIIGYWGWGGDDEQFCSDAEPKEKEQ